MVLSWAHFREISLLQDDLAFLWTFDRNQGAIWGLYEPGIQRGTQEQGSSGGNSREADGKKCFWYLLNINTLATLF